MCSRSSPGSSRFEILLGNIKQKRKPGRRSFLSGGPPAQFGAQSRDELRISHDEICQGWGQDCNRVVGQAQSAAGLSLDWAVSRHERRLPRLIYSCDL